MLENMNACVWCGLPVIVLVVISLALIRLGRGKALARVKPGSRYFKRVIPKRMCIYETTRVAGISFKLPQVLAWSVENKLELLLRAEPGNKQDKNAIMIIGACQTTKGKQHTQLGYLERGIAARIARMNVPGVIDLRARLGMIWISEDLDEASIEFDVIGPREHYKAYCEA